MRAWALEGPDGDAAFKELALAHDGCPEPPRRVATCAALLPQNELILLLVGTEDGSVLCFAEEQLVADVPVGARVEAVAALRGREYTVAARSQLHHKTLRAEPIGGPAWARALVAGAPGEAAPAPQVLSVDGAVVYARFRGLDGVVSTASNSIWFVSWAQGSTVRLESFHATPCRGVTVGIDGITSATFADDAIRVWRGTEAAMAFTCGQRVLSVCFAGRLIVAGYADGCLRLFDHLDLAAVGKVGMGAPVLALAPRGDGVVVGTAAGVVQLASFSAATSRPQVRLKALGKAEPPSRVVGLDADTAGRSAVALARGEVWVLSRSGERTDLWHLPGGAPDKRASPLAAVFAGRSHVVVYTPGAQSFLLYRLGQPAVVGSLRADATVWSLRSGEGYAWAASTNGVLRIDADARSVQVITTESSVDLAASKGRLTVTTASALHTYRLT